MQMKKSDVKKEILNNEITTVVNFIDKIDL